MQPELVHSKTTMLPSIAIQNQQQAANYDFSQIADRFTAQK